MAQDAMAVATPLTISMLLFGTALSMLLMGIETLQVWNYFRKFGRDDWKVRALVICVYSLDIVHGTFFLHTTYTYTMAAIDQNPGSLQSMTWSLATSIPLTGLMALLVEGFYCIRVWSLTQNRPLTAVCGFLTVSRFAVTIATSTTMIRTGSWAALDLREFRGELGTQLSVGAAADVAIALAICSALFRMRSGFASTNRLIDGIVAFTIGSGLGTCLVSVTECIIYLGFEHIGFLIPYAITSNVFSNSLLAALNERKDSGHRSAGKADGDTIRLEIVESS